MPSKSLNPYSLASSATINVFSVFCMRFGSPARVATARPMNCGDSVPGLLFLEVSTYQG